MDNKLILKSDLYSIKAIENAISAYSSIATISVEENVNEFLCNFTNTKYDTLLTMKEFENYLIDISNKMRLFN